MVLRLYSIAILLLMTSSLFSQDRLSGRTFATRSEVIAKNGMAATNHPLATQIALDVLKFGGSAVDAAIAANAFLGFADPAMNGIGGDIYAIIWSAKDQKLFGLNGSGKSPQNLQLQYFKDNNYRYIPGSSPHAVTVPGCVDGWFKMHDKFGKRSMQENLQYAVEYAREGIGVAEEIADMMVYLDELLLTSYTPEGNLSWDMLPEFQKVYMTRGRFPIKGETYSNRDLASTLELIGKEGRDAFYDGEIATTISNHIQSLGGFLSEKDFASHSSEWVEPVSTNYRGYDIWEIPPNGQGAAVLQMLNILEAYDMKNIGFGSKEHIHYFTESKKLAYADLGKYYGDPEISKIPIKELISKDYADVRRKEIESNMAKNYGPGMPDENHTIYLTVADKEGNMVSLIQSNSWLFGSLIVPPGLGFALQNRGTGFKLEEGHINSYAPSKRPFHTIIPAFITKDGDPYVSFGLTGGGMQPQGHVQIVMNLIDFGMNLQEAGDAPRIRHEYPYGPPDKGNTGSIKLESGFNYEVIRDLIKIGHDVSWGFERFGGYQAILFDGTYYYGASESRKDGQAAGY